MRIGFFYNTQDDIKKRQPEYRRTRTYEIFMPVEQRGGWGFYLNLYFIAIGAFLTTDGLDNETVADLYKELQAPPSQTPKKAPKKHTSSTPKA